MSQRVAGRTFVVLLFATAAICLTALSAATITSSPVAATATTTPSTTAPTPTSHSYDDSHSGQPPEGSSPALWILVGAVVLLVAIAVTLMRANKSTRH